MNSLNATFSKSQKLHYARSWCRILLLLMFFLNFYFFFRDCPPRMPHAALPCSPRIKETPSLRTRLQYLSYAYQTCKIITKTWVVTIKLAISVIEFKLGIQNLVFCYHYCSNVLWEKIVLVWGKNWEKSLQIRGRKAENL